MTLAGLLALAICLLRCRPGSSLLLDAFCVTLQNSRDWYGRRYGGWRMEESYLLLSPSHWTGEYHPVSMWLISCVYSVKIHDISIMPGFD